MQHQIADQRKQQQHAAGNQHTAPGHTPFLLLAGMNRDSRINRRHIHRANGGKQGCQCQQKIVVHPSLPAWFK